MSWIDKELKKRSVPTSADTAPAPEADDVQSVLDLWQQLQAVNDALPPELRLQLEVNTLPRPAPLPLPEAMQPPYFEAWLRAPNGAALGLAGSALRYLWPDRARRRSRNFWIRPDPGRGLRVMQRIAPARGGTIKRTDTAFDATRVEYIVRRMVTGKLVSARSVSRRRFWLF